MAANPDVLIVGAGAAGLFAAMAAAREGASTLVLEKTPRIGTKILISGGGKCNIAHAGPLEGVIGAFQKQEAIFIRPSCYEMPNSRIMEMFTNAGLELYTRADGRVFPTDGSAKDVLSIIVEEAFDLGVRICLNTEVETLVHEDRKARGVRVRPTVNADLVQPRGGSEFGAKALLNKVLSQRPGEGEVWSGDPLIACDRVVLTTGGSSYPASGTTGDGWRWARELGHSVVKPRAALAPIYLLEPLVHLAGLAVPSCRLVSRQEGKRIGQEAGDLLFTHQGVSGPVVLKISRSVALALESGPVDLELDLVPDSTIDQIVEKFSETVTVHQWIQDLAPQRLAAEIVESTGFQKGQRISALGRKARIKLAETVKTWPVGRVRTVPLEKGEVVAGGIALSEVDSKTMRSKLVEGLYLAGEILDVAGPVGGYNLQAAFATGNRAGKSAAQDALSDSN